MQPILLKKPYLNLQDNYENSNRQLPQKTVILQVKLLNQMNKAKRAYNFSCEKHWDSIPTPMTTNLAMSLQHTVRQSLLEIYSLHTRRPIRSLGHNFNITDGDSLDCYALTCRMNYQAEELRFTALAK